jgi:zinc/manganese transport system substrate-binding protein
MVGYESVGSVAAALSALASRRLAACCSRDVAARAHRRLDVLILTLALSLVITGCNAAHTAPTANGRLAVVAAENFWGSIAGQLAGGKAQVQSIIANPAQDPHSYEPTAADARALATASLVIVNGIGYDPWAPRLLAANPVSGRVVLNVGDLFGLKQGENPHRWYDPNEVVAVASAVTADLKKLDPHDSRYYDRRLSAFLNRDLARYHALIEQIRSRYGRVPVGASESIFALLAPALGLRLLTPFGFMKAISEGTEVSAQDTLITERQISARQIKVWVYNAQNATPVVQHLNALARRAGIPITTITETLQPASATFEQWQVAQLERLERALHQATGK